MKKTKMISVGLALTMLLAACGMYLLCMNESASLNTGDILVFLCAFGYTAQIMFIDHFAEGTDGVVLSFFQFLICGTLGTIAAFIWGAPAWHQITGGIGALLSQLMHLRYKGIHVLSRRIGHGIILLKKIKTGLNAA